MKLTIGVDLGGTKIAGGVVGRDGVIQGAIRRPTPARDAAEVEAAIVDVVKELASTRKILGVGIGAAGFIDENRSRVVLAPNLGWVDEPLKAAVERKVGLPVVVENDANAATWGEYRFGAGAGCKHLVLVTVGTGIGAGLVLDGKLYRGSHGVAGEPGHMCVEPGGRLCACGGRGCWEQYASGNALVRAARRLAAERRSEGAILLSLGDGSPEGVAGEHVTRAAAAGDPVALAAFEDVGRWLGRGLATIVDILDPERILLGGGVSEAGELILQPTRLAFGEALAAKNDRVVANIDMAGLGNEAGLIGAADLARRY